MGMTIIDGRTHSSAAVDSSNRLKTAGTTETQSEHSCELGLRYNINTGDITLTSAAKTTVLYIKNNEDDDLVIESFIYNLGATTGGTGDVKVDIYRNPTAGGIITNANAVSINQNLNFGSNNTLTVNAYKGATGETVVSGGNDAVSSRLATNTGRYVITLGSVILPKGSSIAINYTPPSSNTSQICQFAASCFLRTKEVSEV